MESSYLWATVNLAAHDTCLSLLTASVLYLLLWRLYTFTIRPWLRPSDPKEYPYWIPVVGHLHSFFKNSSRLISDAKRYFHDTGEPFALSVAGQKWYVLTKAEDVTATYRMEHLSYDIFAVEVMRMIGVSEDGITKAFDTTSHPSKKHLVRLCKEYQLEQLSPGNRLEHLVESSIILMNSHLNISTILARGQNWYATQPNPSSPAITVSLYQWISDLFIDLGTRAYFGPHLLSLEPGLIPTFMSFESLSWQAMYQYPRLLSTSMIAAKEKLVFAMQSFFSTPPAHRPETSWFISQIEAETTRLAISPSDSAIFFFQLFWSINGNTRKAPFWILSYLLCHFPHLLPAIRSETAPAILPDGSGGDGGGVNIAYLTDDKLCPVLNSIWEETTRLTAFAASVRFLTHDVHLGGKVLRRGNRLMMPQRQLHFDAKSFGKTAAEFDPDRFLRDPGLKRHPSFRPFGGGTTMCPGRNLAKQTTLAFVAMVLDRFDVELDPPGQKFPRPAEGKPSIGLVDVTEGEDLRVKLTPRRR
ncbi:Abscisic acid 8'-hydroxylase 4 [Triangularia verruculosa]|uniref:Abscisic acid 8'-hydroxylase 4 n=1 Tax=Triangularia verruculosa TaxID=2587418 RepID=A0AAN6XAZ5_9PEZI|nr:Abscisic acid 8'-hydroxylase 4 [Triangularia verruculosa]